MQDVMLLFPFNIILFKYTIINYTRFKIDSTVLQINELLKYSIYEVYFINSQFEMVENVLNRILFY